MTVEVGIGWAQSAASSVHSPAPDWALAQAFSSVLHLALSAADGGDAVAFGGDEVGVAPQAPFSVLAELAIGDAGQAGPNADLGEEAQLAAVHTGTALLELGEPADGGVQHFHTAPEAIGLESSGACNHTDTLVVEAVRLAPPLANSVDVQVLAELAGAGSGAPGGGSIKLKPLEAVATVVC